MSDDKAQNPNAIMQPEDVENFNFYEEYNMYVAPALAACQNIMNKYGIPHIWISTPRIEREGTNMQSSHAIRINNLSLVRDFALVMAHAAISGNGHADMGIKVADVALKSNDFLEAFFGHLQKAGVFDEVVVKDGSEPTGSQTPPNTNVH